MEPPPAPSICLSPSGPRIMRTRPSHPASRVISLVEALHPLGGTGGSPTSVLLARDPSEVDRIAATLDDDGVAWLTVPPGRRRRARVAVERAGLRVSGSWLAVPSGGPRTLLPLTSVTAADRSLLAARALQGRLAPLLARCSASILEETAPDVGLLVQRANAPPPLAWLADAASAPPVAVRAAWWDPADGIVLYGENTIVKSTGVGAGRDLLHEAEALRTLGATAAAAGARIPAVLYAGPAGSRIALTQAVLPGKRASDLLRARAGQLQRILESVVAWLVSWHLETRDVRPLTARDTEELVIGPAEALAADIPRFDRYLERLRSLAASLRDRAVPFAAAHNDLTTWNVLVESSSIAVVDWEVACAEALPLSDLDYFLVDAVATARRQARDAAYTVCTGDGPDAKLVRRLRAETREKLGVDGDAVELARHASWLTHARNEARRASPGAPRPFLGIVQKLAVE